MISLKKAEERHVRSSANESNAFLNDSSREEDKDLRAIFESIIGPNALYIIVRVSKIEWEELREPSSTWDSASSDYL